MFVQLVCVVVVQLDDDGFLLCFFFVLPTFMHSKELIPSLVLLIYI